jgi:hypothetical protein
MMPALLLALLMAGSAPASSPPAPGAAPPAPQVRPLRVALFDVKVVGEVPGRVVAAFSQSLAPEVRKLEGISALSAAEVQDMLSLERQKALLGCSEDAASCLAEIAGALDADEALSFELTLLGTRYSLTARRMDMRQAQVVHSQVRTFERRDGEELLAMVGPLVEALYPERPLKPGRRRGVEEELVRRLNPPPLPRWAFFTTAGASLGALVAGGAFGVLALETRREFELDAQRSLSEPMPARRFRELQAQYDARTTTASVLFAASGGLALAATMQAFFTDWRDDRAQLSVSTALTPGGAGVLLSGAF